MPPVQTIAPHDRVKAFRAERGLSRTQLAALIGCDESMVAHLETGRRKPGRRLANDLEEATRDAAGGPIRSEDWDAFEDAARAGDDTVADPTADTDRPSSSNPEAA